MSGSSSVAAMKKVVQQLRLEAGLNRVKVSGRGRASGRTRGASGPGGGGLWAAGAVSPPFRRLLPAPAGLCTGHPVSPPTFESHFSQRRTPVPRPLNTHKSAPVTSNYGTVSKFACGVPRESQETTLAQYSLEQRGVWTDWAPLARI